ncbi:EamA family transporter [Cohnella caldifontis]|uniref:EamA family transporter n=1 Tax=Cohnella caldifontis TaxID=3027471 RepID=UPI0023EBC10E|nr:EamA family transporter [Cohnella sp. YIM B05605]
MVLWGYLSICLIYGTTYFAIKLGLNEGIPPLLMAAIRFGLAGLLLVPYLAYRNARFPRSLKAYAEMAFLGALMTAIPFAALFWSEQHIPTGVASLLVATSPVFIGLFERVDRWQKVGIAAAFAGLALVALPELTTGGDRKNAIWAALSIVLSEAAFSYGVIRTRKAFGEGVSSLMLNALQMIFGSLLLFALSGVTENFSGIHWNGSLVFSILYLSVAASVVASGIYYWLVQVTNPLFPTTWTMVSPIVAVFVGALFLHETITWIGAAGTAVALAGIVLVNRKLLRF